MAYEQAAYHAPGRAYHGQVQQQAPVQAGYRGQAHQQYGQYEQAYHQDYRQQQPAGYDSYDQDVNHSQGGAYGNAGMQNAYGHEQSYDGGYGQQQNRGHERSYDSRYQQRPARSALQGQGQGPRPEDRAKPRPERQASHTQIRQGEFSGQQYGQQTPQPDRQGYQVPVNNQQRPDQRNGQHPGSHIQQGQANIRPRQEGGRAQGIGQVASAKQAEPQRPDKMTMEGWKAQEKAKMHAAALSSEVLAQDTAFPTFPTKPKGVLAGGASAISQRSSEEQARPSTSSSRRPSEYQRERRPGVSRDNSYSTTVPPSSHQHVQQGTPSIDHKHFAFDPVQGRPSQDSQHRPGYQRQPSGIQNSSPVNARQLQQWPTNGQQSYQRQQPPPDRESTQRQNGYDEAYQEAAPQQQPPPAQRRPPQARGQPPAMPIDTRQAQTAQRPIYRDHQPLSPGIVPARPSTAQPARPSPVLHNQVASPISLYSSSATPRDYHGSEPPLPQVWAEQGRRHGSLGDVYDSYHDNTTPVTAPPRTREEEIEAEMPDFDSAAPGGTSMLHKRKQNEASEAPPQPLPMEPTPHPNQTAQYLPVQKPRFYQQQHDPSVASLPDPRAAKAAQGGITDGLIFGVPGEQAPHDQYSGVRRPPQQQQRDFQYSQGASTAGPQPAFANQRSEHRSMDDARQMPYRQAPPQAQRFDRNGQPLRGPLLPQQLPQRPDFDRNATEQTMWSDPGAQRVGSAPPRHQGLAAPPGRAPSGRAAPNGAPLSQQRSTTEQQCFSDPDALPHHPTPVRPGLMDQGSGSGPAQHAKPPPVRHYDAASVASRQRQTSIDRSSRPVTHQELDQLRVAVSANPLNNKQALLLAKKLVEAGDTLASEGGRADARTTARNRENYILDAHKRIKKLVSAGYPDAMFYLADSYGQGSLGLEVDTKEAFNLYQAAAKAGHPAAAYRTAVCCEMGPEEGGGTRKDYAKSVQWYRRGAALGDTAAMYKLGMILLKGLLGQQRNVGEAVIWLKHAAENADEDSPHALHELGLLHDPQNTNAEVRNKVVADANYARPLFQQAAALGYKFSQFRLGQAYEYGSLGLPIDNRASISWYTKAAAQGEHQAELALSGWYLTGAEGILDHSDTEAYLWARKAASSEPPLAKAMFAMGYFSETGIGCPADVEEARRWYGRAASYKFPKAMERLEELKKSGGRSRPQPANGKLTRKDQKRDEAECVVM